VIRLSGLITAMMGLLVAAALQAQHNPQDVSPESIAQLIRQLGAATFADREKATQALAAIGEAALPALKEAAAKSQDPEVRRRASDLVRVIEARLAAEKLRRPTLISVAYHNTPLADVLKDLTAKTGVPFRLQVSPNREAQVRHKLVTIRLDQKPLWEVVDQVLAACGLRQVECDPNEQVFTVEEGALDRDLLWYSGAARIRRLVKYRIELKPPEGRPATSIPQPIPLEVCIEPQRFIAEGEPGISEAQLLDEKGLPIQAKARLAPAETPEDRSEQQPPIVIVPQPGGQIQVNARIIAPGNRPRQSRWRVLAILTVEKDTLQKAAAVRGQLDVRVLTRTELVIANPVHAEPKAYGDPNRFQVRLVRASQNGQQVKITLETSQVPQGNAVPIGAGPGLMPNPNQDIQLFDDNDQVCRLASCHMNFTQAAGNNTVAIQMELTFWLPKATAKPSRLVILNHAPTTLTLPFQFALTSR